MKPNKDKEQRLKEQERGGGWGRCSPLPPPRGIFPRRCPGVSGSVGRERRGISPLMCFSSAPLYWWEAGRVPGSHCLLGIVVLPSSSGPPILPSLPWQPAGQDQAISLLPQLRVFAFLLLLWEGKHPAVLQASFFPPRLIVRGLLQEASGEERCISRRISVSVAACNPPGRRKQPRPVPSYQQMFHFNAQ